MGFENECLSYAKLPNTLSKKYGEISEKMAELLKSLVPEVKNYEN